MTTGKYGLLSNDPRDITVKLTDVTIDNVYHKFDSAVEILEKAMHVHVTDKTDVPHTHLIPAVNYYEFQFGTELIDGASKVIEGIAKGLHLAKARGDSPFVLPNSGKVVRSLKTGKPLTQREWAEIGDAIDKYLRAKGVSTAERAVKRQTALGVLVARMERDGEDITRFTEQDSEKRLESLYNQIMSDKPFVGWDDLSKTLQDNLMNHIEANFARTAEYVTSLSDKTRSSVKQILVQAIKDRASESETVSRLFAEHGKLNMDWRRIARTESRAAFTDGRLSEEMAYAESTGEDAVYFIGKSAVDACPVCVRDIRDKVVKLLTAEPKGGSDQIDNDRYATTAIWLGKTSVGSSNKERYSVIPRHPHCYSDDTEVYTRSGWKLFKDVTAEDEIFTLQTDTHSVYYQKSDGLVAYHYKGDMLHWQGKNCNLLVTPDHKNYMSYSHHGRRYYDLREAREMATLGHSQSFMSSDWCGDEVITAGLLGAYAIPLDVYCEFMGYYLSEGSVMKRVGGGYLIQLSQFKHFDKMLDCVKRLRVFHVMHSREKGKIYFYDKSVFEDLQKYGHSHEKFVPEIIKKCSPKYLRIFLDAYTLGDGTKRWKIGLPGQVRGGLDWTIGTSSKRMADDLCEVVIKAQYSVSYYLQKNQGVAVTHKNGEYVGNYDIWRVNIKNNRYVTMNRHNVKLVPYDGMVYDVSLPNDHVLLVRRGGRVVWSGNCRCLWVRWYPELAESTNEVA